MRGSPLVRALIAFFIIGLMGWPLWRLTRPEVIAATVQKAATSAVKKAINLHLTFTNVPKSFVIRNVGQEIWKGAAPEVDMEQEVTTDYPDEGVDLQIHVEWPEDGPLSAMRIQLTDPAGDKHEKSIWGKGAVDEVVTFP
jgi:hypothetical protein